jgi:hypothetical protein
MGTLRARRVLVKTEAGAANGFAVVLGAAVFRFGHIRNGSELPRRQGV